MGLKFVIWPKMAKLQKFLEIFRKKKTIENGQIWGEFITDNTEVPILHIRTVINPNTAILGKKNWI